MIKCSEINRSNLKLYKNMSSISSCPHNKSLAICMINRTWEVCLYFQHSGGWGMRNMSSRMTWVMLWYLVFQNFFFLQEYMFVKMLLMVQDTVKQKGVTSTPGGNCLPHQISILFFRWHYLETLTIIQNINRCKQWKYIQRMEFYIN